MARVVVVDDDADLTDVVAAILQDEGHEVTPCDTAEDALRCVLAEQPDLVLLDLRLGGQTETGWTILEQLRLHPRTAMLPVIVSSGAVTDLDAREGWLQEQRIPVLPKPFDLDDLLSVVKAAIGQDASTASRLHA